MDIPEPLLKIFCELLASASRIFRSPDVHEFFIRLLLKIPPNLETWLFEKRFPLRPFIDHIDAKRIFPGIGQPSQVLRKRWRILRKRLISGLGETCSLADQGLETTLGDLRFLKTARTARTYEICMENTRKGCCLQSGNCSAGPTNPSDEASILGRRAEPKDCFLGKTH